jgi:plasmid stability protein
VLHVEHMKKMIQIRNVPAHVHRALKVRAAQAGLSLSDYLLGELGRIVEKPTLDELWNRIAAREPADPGESAAAAIRAERDAAEAEQVAPVAPPSSASGKRTRSA